MNNILKLTFLFLLFQSCQEENRNQFKPYYFPIEDLKEGKVYEFHSVGNEYDPPFYWFVRSIEIEGSTYLTVMYYDYNFQPYQFVREEVVSNGMLLADMYLYETDTLTGKQNQIFVNIDSGNVFPFEKKEPAPVLLSSIQWQQDSLTTMTFVRNRQYLSDTSVVFKSDKIEAIKLNALEMVDSEVKGEGHLEQEYAGKEIYAWGIGLIYFEKNISPEWQMRYALKDIYNMETFEEKFRTNLGK